MAMYEGAAAPVNRPTQKGVSEQKSEPSQSRLPAAIDAAGPQ